MVFLYVVFTIVAWLAIGWLISLAGVILNKELADEFECDNVSLVMAILVWPLFLLFLLGTLFVDHLHPTKIVESMRERKAQREKVIVKSRRFRGRSD